MRIGKNAPKLMKNYREREKGADKNAFEVWLLSGLSLVKNYFAAKFEKEARQILGGRMLANNHLLDQHFLKNVRLALMLIGHSNLKHRDTVVEIGRKRRNGTGEDASGFSLSEKGSGDFQKLQKFERTRSREREARLRDFREVNLFHKLYKVFSNPPFSLSAEVFISYLISRIRTARLSKRLKKSAKSHLFNFTKTIGFKIDPL